MAADVAATLPTWSVTRSSNQPAGTTTVGTGWDDNLREIQGVVRAWLASKGADIASAGTTDLGAVEGFSHDITGTTTITSFGTLSAGIHKVVKFEGTLTLTHNATSLILPGGASITTADGDVAWVESEGSGNWRCLSYVRANGAPASATYSEFAATTAIVFNQTAAPTGWTKSTTHDNKALRVVTGAVSSGGATAFTTVFGSGKATGGTSISVAQLPPHHHTTRMVINGNATPGNQSSVPNNSTTAGDDTGDTGTGDPHTHTVSLDLQYVDVIVATKN